MDRDWGTINQIQSAYEIQITVRYRYYWLLNDQPSLLKALTQILQSKPCKDDDAIFRLSSAGIIRRDKSGHLARNELYQSYFSKKLNLVQ